MSTLGQPHSTPPRRESELDPDPELLRASVLSETAAEAFADLGLMCSEAVLIAACEALGLESRLVPHIALGLGAGVGRRGHTCGAVTGCALAISLALGERRMDREARKTEVLTRVGRLCRALEERLGTVECRTLTGLDLSLEEDRARFREDVKDRVCRPLVAEAARLLAYELEEILERR
jgi:C_GCAxxG_C_C family probable redox protein